MKKKIILSISILIATTFMSIGYAAINMSFDITGTINAKAQNDIFIIEPTIIDTTNVNNTIEINQIYKTILDSTISINNLGSDFLITYQVTVYNNTQSDYAFKGIISDNGTYDNSQIKYSYSGINLNDVITSGQFKTFNVTLSNNTTSKNSLRSYMNVAFGKNYTITYEDFIISDGMQTNIAAGLTYTNTFTNPPDDIEVTMGGNVLVKGTDFTYTNGNIRIPNVTGNIRLKAKSQEPVMAQLALNGLSLATKIKTLANNGTYVDGYSTDTKIKAIKWATKNQYEAKKSTLTSDNIISIGTPEVYTWFENDTIYFYSEADSIAMNGNMEKAFCKMTNLADISALAYFDTTNASNMNRMFQDSVNITDLSHIADWDVSNITDMTFMFGANVGATSSDAEYMHISSLEPLKNWNVGKVTSMEQTFKGCKYVTSLTPLKDWNVSKVTTFKQTFNRTGLTDATPIVDWNVRNVTIFDMMLAYTSNLPANKRPIFTVRPGTWNSSGTYTPSS